MRAAVATAAAFLLIATPAAADELRKPGEQGPLGTERLSNERTVTRWAHAVQVRPIRAQSRRKARRVTHLRLLTEDRRPEVYLVLRSRRVRGMTWLQVRVPGRPNGRKGWVPQEALGRLHVVRTHLTINRTTLRATLRRRGKIVWSSPIGVGAPGTPTPAGRFWIREKLKGWGGVYGPLAFGTAAYSRLSEWPGGGVIGIHGTNQPGLIPGRPSHGCIRVPNHNIRRLARRMPIGTPVRIS